MPRASSLSSSSSSPLPSSTVSSYAARHRVRRGKEGSSSNGGSAGPSEKHTAQQFLEFVPAVLEFCDIVEGAQRSTTLQMWNRDSTLHRIRVFPPKTAEFTLATTPPAWTVAPGLATTAITVNFQCKSVHEYHGVLPIRVDDEKFEFPLHAYPPRPVIQCDPYVDLGMVLLNASTSKYVELANTGALKASVTVVLDDDTVSIQPTTLTILPDNVETVKVELHTNKLGAVHAVATINIAGYPTAAKTLDISALVMDQHVDLVRPDGGGVLERIDFGSLYFGESQQARAILVNNGPHSTDFEIQARYFATPNAPRREEEEGELIDGEEKLTSKLQEVASVLTIEPTTGSIQPYSDTEILFMFHPVRPVQRTGFKATQTPSSREYILSATVRPLGMNRLITLGITGRGVTPQIVLSPTSLRFGDVPTYDRADAVLTIKNESMELPVNYELGAVPHYHFCPSKGKLLPMQSESVVATFSPNCLGTHNTSTSINIATGTQTIALKLSGTSSKMGQRRKVLGGPDKLPEDFKPTLKFVDPRGVRAPKRQWDIKGGEIRGKQSNRLQDALDEQFGYTGEQRTKRLADRRKYVDFLQRMKHERALKDLRVSQEKADPVDLGMEPGSGLEDPGLRLPPIEDVPFTLASRVKGGDTRAPNARTRTTVHDENRIFKRKFKPKPTTQAEIKECKATLSPRDLLLVSVGPSTIDFGTVSVQSRQTKSLVVTNDLDTHVLVAIHITDEELKLSHPESQVIPSGCTAGFDITFVSERVNAFQRPVHYVINGCHKREFLVVAEAVPMCLKLDVEELVFRFEETGLEMSTSHTVTIHNSGAFPTYFLWAPRGDAFTIQPEHGMVDSGQSMSVVVTFEPTASCKENVEEILVLQVQGGQDQRLKCMGKITEGKVAFTDKKLDFGTVSVGIDHEKTVTLKNTGADVTVFTTESSDPRVNVHPSRAYVPAGALETLKIIHKCPSPETIESTITVKPRAGKPQKLPIVLRGVIPSVEVIEDEFDFMGVLVGTLATRKLTLRNNGNVPAVLFLNLSKHSDFDAKWAEDGKGHSSGCFIRPVRWDDESGTEIRDVDEKSRKDAPPSKVFKINVAAGGIFALDLCFTPSKVDTYAFELPLQLSGIPSVSALRRAVAGEGLKPRLTLSTYSLQFNQAVISRERFKRTNVIDLILTNGDDLPLAWEFDTETEEVKKAGAQDVFRFEPTKGKLEPRHEQIVRVLFFPERAVVYECHVPLHLDGRMEQPYLELPLHGVGIHPAIEFDVKEVILPTVPLGVVSSASFHVINKGYDNVKLQYTLPGDPSELPLSLCFPQGPGLSNTEQSLPVEVQFSSTRPLCFSSKIEFWGCSDNVFTIPIKGIAENCLLTVFPYIESSGMEIVQREAEGFALAPLTCDDPQQKPSQETARPPALASVAQWLQAVVPGFNCHRLPADFISRDGKEFVRVVEFLSGKKITMEKGEKDTKGDKSLAERTECLQRTFESVLSLLKKQGAFVVSIQPSLMLSWEMYSWLEGDCKDEDTFNTLSQCTWETLLFQIIKVFALCRISAKSFRSVPGVRKDTMEGIITRSNVYGIPECILLHWLTLHHNRFNPFRKIKVVDFGADLHDGVVLGSVLLSHIPTLHRLHSALRKGTTAKSDADRNAEHIVDALLELGLHCPISPQEIVQGTSRTLLLFVLYLYHNLPQFIPKTTVKFTGAIGDTVVKKIELTNPSARPVTYAASLEGSPDFHIEETPLTLGPKSTGCLEITLLNRFSRLAEGRLTLHSKRSGGLAPATTLVFLLQSDTTRHKPVATYHVEGPLYETRTLDLAVQPPFQGDCEFQVTLSESFVPVPDRIGGGKQGGRKDRGVEADGLDRNPHPSETDASSAETVSFPKAFSISPNRLRIKKDAAAVVQATFLPFRMGTYTAQLLFLDEKAGEFAYELHGVGGFPSPLEKIQWKCEHRASLSREIVLTPLNVSLEDALRRRGVTDLPHLRAAGIPFTVDVTSPYMSAARDVVVRPKDMTGGGGKGGRHSRPASADAPSNRLCLEFHPKAPGIYHSRVILRSLADLRVYEIEATVSSPGQKLSLEFVTAARQHIAQDIPLVNNTEKEMIVRASLKGQYFNGPSELRIPANSTRAYTLVFAPKWICTSMGDLVLVNVDTGEKVTYELRGTAEPPLPEETVEIECKARWKVSQTIKVSNPTSVDAVFRVESDLPYVSGVGEVHVPSHGHRDYDLTVLPLLSGTYSGTVTFIAPDSEYRWYNIVVKAQRPEPERELEIRTVTHQAVAVEIGITNPHRNPVEFEVSTSGPGLLGDPTIFLQPGEHATYELVYAPFFPGEESGSISFFNAEVGEFWYRLHLTADRPEPTALPTMECPVGQRTTHMLQIENPVDEEIRVSSSVTQLHNFVLRPANFTIAPFSTTEVALDYIPSSIGHTDAAVIRFVSSVAGEWVFHTQGIGSAPSEAPPVEVTCPVGRMRIHNFPFRNPFPDPLRVSVTLRDTATHPGTFELRLKKPSDVVVAASTTLSIPLVYTPHAVADDSAVVCVETSRANMAKLVWTFPIKGIAEVLDEVPFVFTCKARTLLEEVLDLPLAEAAQIDGEEPFDLEVVSSPDMEVLVSRFVNVTPLSRVLTRDRPLQVKLTFEPLKPLYLEADLLIHRKSGGRWRYSLAFEASEPEFDDVIVIESTLHKTSSVSFRLTNQFSTSAPFVASFSTGSSKEFTIHPETGSLGAYGSMGTQFVLSFTPRAYGKTAIATLVIETEEMMWRYEVRGTHPQYVAPAKEAKVRHKPKPL